jgi:hypothetical protein
MRRLIAALAAGICPQCGWWAEPGHQCHPADR